MREPYFRNAVTSAPEEPYSLAPSHDLRQVVSGAWDELATPTEDGSYDIGFRRMYAAILLKERGQ